MLAERRKCCGKEDQIVLSPWLPEDKKEIISLEWKKVVANECWMTKKLLYDIEGKKLRLMDAPPPPPS